MIILSSLAPPSSFQLGIRAICRQSERTFCAAAARQLSTASRTSSQRCSNYSPHGPGPLGPSRHFRHGLSRHEQLLPRITVRSIFRFRAIVHYSQIPSDYEDAKGLAFRKEELSRTEVNKIFGPNITPTNANLLLKVIHGRRVAGTLDDPDLQQNTATFRAEDKIKALEYLREHVPVDEIINAGLRAEDELRLLEEQEQEQDSEQVEEQHEGKSPQKKSALPEESVDEEPKLPLGQLPQKKTESPYGESLFDRIRKRNQAINEAEEKRLEEERIKREEEEALQNIGGLQTEQAKPQYLSTWRRQHAERATSDLKAPPEMKAWERLLPASIFTLVVLAACVVLAAYYKPPSRDWRIWPDIPPAAATCLGLMAMNVLVYALWKFPPMWPLMNKYMLVIPATPRPLQLLGAIFSHQSAGHLAGNMLALWFFGIRLHEEIGRGNFLALYFGSGTFAFLTSMFNLVLWRGIQFTTMGASGAIYGIIASFFWVHRNEEFKIFGYPPDPWSGPSGATFLGLLVGLHVWAGVFSRGAAMTLDVASHIGGIAAGIVGIELIQKFMDDRARARAEREKELSKSVDVMGKLVEQKLKSDK